MIPLSVILDFLVRHRISHRLINGRIEIPCLRDPSHKSFWNPETGYLGCILCDRIWRGGKVLDGLKARADASESALEHLGWRSLVPQGAGPWLMPSAAKRFHENLLAREDLQKSLLESLGFDRLILEAFLVGFSGEMFLPEERGRYSNCFVLPVVTAGVGWSGFLFFGKRLLEKKAFNRMRVLGKADVYWTLRSLKASGRILASNPIEAIQIAAGHRNNPLPPEVLCCIKPRGVCWDEVASEVANVGRKRSGQEGAGKKEDYQCTVTIDQSPDSPQTAQRP